MRATLSMALLLSALLPGIARGADADRDASHRLYMRYCGACHGAVGEGDGMVASFMTPRPPDLTRLAVNSGGTFPTHKVMSYIDGTSDIRAHGEPTMPVWGDVFRAEAGSGLGSKGEVQGKLLMITDYLRSIQAK